MRKEAVVFRQGARELLTHISTGSFGMLPLKTILIIESFFISCVNSGKIGFTRFQGDDMKSEW